MIAQLAQIPAPLGIWPTTVFGWISLFGAIVSVGITFWGLHRHGVLRARKEAKDEARMQRGEERFNEFRATLEKQMNGFGRRLEKIETDAAGDREIVNGVLQTLAGVAADLRNTTNTTERIERTLDQVRNDIRNLSRPAP